MPLANLVHVGQLLNERAKLLAALIELDPSQAIAAGFRPEIASRLRTMAPQAEIESQGEWEGVLEAIVGDDFEHQRSRTQWYLRTPNRKFELYTGVPTIRQAGTSARVSGIMIAGRIAAGSLRVVRSPSAAAQTQQQCTTIGPQNIAVLMITTPSNPVFPSGYTTASFSQAFFGSPSDAHSTDSLNGYWRETSYGLTSVTGQVFGPFATSLDCGCGSPCIVNAAIQQADATVDFTQFTRLAIVYPVQSCEFGGMDTVGCQQFSSPSKGTLTVSAAWLPAFPNDQPHVPVYAHELGHALGLDHSRTEDYNNSPLGPLNRSGAVVEYGDLFSVMGFLSTGPTGVLGQYTAPQKSGSLHWLTTGDYQEVRWPGTFILTPYESFGGTRALRVSRDLGTGAWLWLENRQPIGDVERTLQNLPGATNVFSGAVIHYENPAIGDATLLDFNGAELVAALYNRTFPAVLCTNWNNASVDEMRRFRR